MFKCIKFPIGVFCFLFLLSCSQTNTKPLLIAFSSDSSQIVIKDINEAGLFQLKTNINKDSSYQNLVTVLQTPNDDDSISMEIEWQGKLSLKFNELLFTPNQPFVKGKTYLVETIINSQFASGKDIIKGKVGTQIKPQQQILKR